MTPKGTSRRCLTTTTWPSTTGSLPRRRKSTVDRTTSSKPSSPDGFEAFIQFVTNFVEQFPQMSLDIKRAIAEGDIVATHSLLKTSPEDRGTAAADFFRLEDGKIVEHWDVLQPVPESAANDHPMF